MRRLLKTAWAALAATVFTAPAWAAIDVTGLNPWACYEFNGDINNTGSGGRGWNGGGSSSSAPGATGAANTAVSINKWTNTGNVSTVGGLTVSLLATEGTGHSTADEDGHIFSLAAKGQAGEPQWWLRNTGTTGQVKLQGGLHRRPDHHVARGKHGCDVSSLCHRHFRGSHASRGLCGWRAGGDCRDDGQKNGKWYRRQ